MRAVIMRNNSLGRVGDGIAKDELSEQPRASLMVYIYENVPRVWSSFCYSAKQMIFFEAPWDTGEHT